MKTRDTLGDRYMHAIDPIDPEQCPSAWFALLESALRRERYDLAEKADRELRRLGVVVEWQRLPRPKENETVDQ